MKTLLKGGSVVSGSGVKRADVLMDGEKILRVGRGLADAADAVQDVSGCLLFPGFIDAHTHFDLDVAGTTTADDFYTGSRAALRGGTTTVIDFACPNKGETLHHGLELWHQKADGRTFCDYGFHMTIDDWNEGIRAELPDMFAQGVSSFKMYMTYPAMMIGDRDMYWALKELRRLGGICGVHCENAGVIDGMIAERKNSGKLGPGSHPVTRPPYLEAEAVSRLLRIAQAADCPVVIVHLTNHEALKEVEHARKRGQIVYVETCPQYLLLAMSARRPCGKRRSRNICGKPCATAVSRRYPRTTAPSPWPRRTWAGRTSQRSPADCPAWRPGESSCTPTAWPSGSSTPPSCAVCCARTPPGCMVSIPARACCAGAATPTSWCTIPRPAI